MNENMFTIPEGSMQGATLPEINMPLITTIELDEEEYFLDLDFELYNSDVLEINVIIPDAYNEASTYVHQDLDILGNITGIYKLNYNIIKPELISYES